MFRALISSAIIVMISGATPPKEQKSLATALPVTVSDVQPSPFPSASYDGDAERQLLDLANQARREAGLAPLQAEDALTAAAREHAAAMASQGRLSHQFLGEPPLEQRIASASKLHLDRAGENVSYASSAEQAHDNLMHSPPHRANLLNAGYNVAGFGVVRDGSVLYVTQDFGHNLPALGFTESADAIIRAVARSRKESGALPLQNADLPAAQTAACAMAQADTLHTAAPAGRYVFRYTAMQPDVLPSGAARGIADPSVHYLSLGSCYGRSHTYPNGVYWVLLILN